MINQDINGVQGLPCLVRLEKIGVRRNKVVRRRGAG